ncbi:MAG: DUF2935 domain-containing protein [Bacillota bacterium]|jgi:hypothetical protein
MENNQKYVVLSLELNLFFGRIMKEHSFFLEAGFTPAAMAYAKRADQFKAEFEKLLLMYVELSNGIVSPAVLNSGEIVTQYTLDAEKKTQQYTGIRIDQSITTKELNLRGSTNPRITPQLVNEVKRLNRNAIRLVDGLIDFKEQILAEVSKCELFTTNYPTLIEHILREAQRYRNNLTYLESGRLIDFDNIKQDKLFWDQIMMEHALFIRGLLDPSEEQLIKTANDFANDYENLLARLRPAREMAMPNLINENISLTMRLRDFKTAGVKGLLECRIKSIILPLLGDHVLREANHYLRILRR